MSASISGVLNYYPDIYSPNATLDVISIDMAALHNHFDDESQQNQLNFKVESPTVQEVSTGSRQDIRLLMGILNSPHHVVIDIRCRNQ